MQEVCVCFSVAYLSYFVRGVRRHLKLFLSSQLLDKLSIITIPNNLILFKNLDLTAWI